MNLCVGHCILALAVFALLAGCQQTSGVDTLPVSAGQAVVPIDEARKTLAEFNKVDFKAPPRSTADIFDILKKAPDPASDERQRLIQEATKVIPADASNHSVFVHQFARSRAAGALGWTGRQIDDLRRALKWIERFERGEDIGFALDPSFPKAVRRDAAWAELSDGNFSRATDLFKAAAYAYIGGWQWDQSAWRELSGLAIGYASAGDLNAAMETAAEAKAFSDDAGQTTGTIWSGQDRQNPWRRIYELSTSATILEVQGKWTEAEEPLRRAIHLFQEQFGALTVLPYAHGRADEWQDLQRAKLAYNLMAQGRYPEAEVVAREALSIALKEKGKYAKTTTVLLGIFVDLMMAEGRFHEAEALADEILNIHDELRTPSGSRLRGSAAFQRAATHALSGDGREGFRKYQAARTAFDRNRETFDRFFASDPTFLLTLARFGPVNEARKSVRDALQRSIANRGRDHYDAAEFLAMSAIIDARSGAEDQALQSFRDAIDTMTEKDRQSRASGHVLPVKRKRLQIILESYIGLLARDGAGTGATVAEAFRLAGFAQAHTVEWALAKALARRQTVDPALASLIRSEQDAERQLDALYRLLSQALVDGGNVGNTVATQLRNQISVLERSRVSVGQEIEREFPEYISLINPPPMTIDAVQRFLKPGESLISFFVGEDRTYIWAIPFAGEVSFHAAAIGREKINHAVKTLRRALDPDPVTLADIPAFNVDLAHELFATLLAPVSRGWEGSDSLIVVPHEALAQIPLAVLVVKPARIDSKSGLLFSEYRKVPWLSRSHSISTLPSVASLRALRQTAAKSSGNERFAGFGDPVFSPRQAVQMSSAAPAQIRGAPVAFRAPVAVRSANTADLASLPRLPDTAAELRAVAKALGASAERSVFLGRKASEERVKSSDLSQTQTISFATHGLVAGDLDGLGQPALALSSPLVTRGEEDGLLTMEEITALKLNADWVVLSACNTAAAAGEGAEAVSGLGRAFFYAGARALLVSNWPVHSAATTELMTTLFGQYSQDVSLSRDGALQNAMTAMIDKGTHKQSGGSKPVFSYAHPIFWAPFTLVGDRVSERAVN